VFGLDDIFAAAATEEWAAHGARAVLGFHWMVLRLVHLDMMFSLLRHMMRIHGKYGNDDSEEDGHLHSRYRCR
jgi:hypothetical protein